MSNSIDFFTLRPQAEPEIYAYEDTNPQYKGLLKVGYTTIGVQKRVKQQYPTARPGDLPYHIVFEESAMRNDGTSFIDKDVHRCLRKRGFYNPEGEWFECSIKQVRAAVLAVRDRKMNVEDRSLDFKMRPEQEDAVEKTAEYFKNYAGQENKTPHFLWNCKMRFGKTFAAYELAKKMGWKRILVLTFKPAVENAWEEDLMEHVDFESWQFISRHTDLTYDTADRSHPIVCFGSFQDYLGKTPEGGIKTKNEWVHCINWDCVILDEYHYGA